MTNLDSILKSRDITLPTKVPVVKAMIFPVVVYGCESWTVKKLSTEILMLLNCGVGEDSLESLGLQGKVEPPPHISCVHFALVASSSEPSSVRKIVGFNGKTPSV